MSADIARSAETIGPVDGGLDGQRRDRSDGLYAHKANPQLVVLRDPKQFAVQGRQLLHQRLARRQESDHAQPEPRAICHQFANVKRPTTLALTQFWCRFGSWRTDHSCLQQVDLSTPIHLSFEKLEPCDLAFGLAVGPG